MRARIVLAAAAGAMLLYACTLTRNLDYLSDGAKDAGTTVGDGGTSSSSSSGGDQTGDAGPTVGTVIASAQYAPANLVQDASNVYWTTDDNKVMKLAKAAPAGTAPTELAKLDGPVQQITQAVVDPSETGTVYLLLGTSAIKALPKAGGTPTDVTAIAAPVEAQTIAVDDTNLFVLAESDPNDTQQALLYRYPKTAPFTQTQLSNVGTLPTTMILTSDSVFWAVTDQGGNYSMLQLPKSAAPGATPTAYTDSLLDQGAPVGISPTVPYEVVVDAQTFYWIDESEDTAYFQPLAPPAGKATKLFTPSNTADTIFAIAEDGTNVYLTISSDPKASTLLRIPKGGGAAPATLHVPAVDPSEVIVDAQSIYVAFNGSEQAGTAGGILKLAK